MDERQVSARLADVENMLQKALDQKEPYYLIIDGVETPVTRADILVLQMELAVEEINAIRHLVDGITITELGDGGCEVYFEGEFIYYSKEEIAEMELDYKAAIRRVLTKKVDAT